MIFDMLSGEYSNRSFKRLYDGHLPLYTQLQVSLGVNRDLSGTPHWITYLLEKPVTISGREYREIGVKHYSFDPSLAPPGKSVLEIMLRTTYGYWQHIYGHRLYDTEQLQVADIVIGLLEQWYPGIKSQIEVVDVATPLTYERYTGNWQGANTGWLLTPATLPMLIKGMRKTLPRLRNFYLAGQWVEPGGSVPAAAASGRNAIQSICHADGRSFVSSLPGE